MTLKREAEEYQVAALEAAADVYADAPEPIRRVVVQQGARIVRSYGRRMTHVPHPSGVGKEWRSSGPAPDTAPPPASASPESTAIADRAISRAKRGVRDGVGATGAIDRKAPERRGATIDARVSGPLPAPKMRARPSGTKRAPAGGVKGPSGAGDGSRRRADSGLHLADLRRRWQAAQGKRRRSLRDRYRAACYSAGVRPW